MTKFTRLLLGLLLALTATWAACSKDTTESKDTDSGSHSEDSNDTGTGSGNGTASDEDTGSEQQTVSSTEQETETQSDTQSASETETQTTTETNSTTESDTTTPGDGFCRYVIPFGGAFLACREYLETWTPEERAADCANPLMGMAEPGVLDGTPCSTKDLLGTCLHDMSTDHMVLEYYYTGPIDVYETNCTGMLGGTWEAISTDLPDWAGPMAEALPGLVSDTAVTVDPDDCSEDTCMLDLYQNKGWLTFAPADITPTTGLVFWPGGNVDARSYAVLVRAIAEAGVLVALPVLPPSSANQAQAIMDDNTGISKWFFGGHSMGGATAQQLGVSHPEMISGGLVLVAAPGSVAADLSDAAFDVLLVSATLDGLATPGEIEDGKAYLPSGTTYVVIDGGNHAQFGHYGSQDGDNEATITRDDQQAQTVAATLAFLGIE